MPAEFHDLLRSTEYVRLIADFWKLNDRLLSDVFTSIPTDLQPLFAWRLNKKQLKQGKLSNIPYSDATIDLATRLMRLEPGSQITLTSSDEPVTLVTVALVVTVKKGGKRAKLSISRVADTVPS